MGCKFHTLFTAVSRAMAQTPRSSALVENLNSRLLFTAPADGTYRLVATSFEGMGIGTYYLTVRAFVDPKK